MEWGGDLARRVSTRGDIATVLLCGTAGFVVDAFLLPMGVPPGTVATLAATGGLGIKNAIQASFGGVRDEPRLRLESERIAASLRNEGRQEAMRSIEVERPKSTIDKANEALNLLKEVQSEIPPTPRLYEAIDRLQKEITLYARHLIEPVKLAKVTDESIEVYRQLVLHEER